MTVCFIAGALVEIHDDIASVLIAADVKAVRIGFAGIGEGIEIRDTACRINALKFRAEAVFSVRLDCVIRRKLAQPEPVHDDFVAGKETLHLDLFILKPFVSTAISSMKTAQ